SGAAHTRRAQLDATSCPRPYGQTAQHTEGAPVGSGTRMQALPGAQSASVAHIVAVSQAPETQAQHVHVPGPLPAQVSSARYGSVRTVHEPPPTQLPQLPPKSVQVGGSVVVVVTLVSATMAATASSQAASMASPSPVTAQPPAASAFVVARSNFVSAAVRHVGSTSRPASVAFR